MTAAVLEMPQTVSRSGPTPQQKAAAHLAQAWVELGRLDDPEAQQLRAELRAMVPRAENIRAARGDQ